ncbi:NH(3)-dependent NAD(+) synthetase [archaeon HR06]|nr:NH(3)-dependent NAD(+) synthetase [archaeon HR06]
MNLEGLEEELREKAIRLESWFKTYSKALVAYSGGVDSSLVAYFAKLALGDNAAALTLVNPTYADYELEEAERVAKFIGIRHIIIKYDSIVNPKIAENPSDRCFFCRSDLVKELVKVKEKENFDVLVDGTILDDLKDYRPGLKALKEGGVKSPLLEIGFKKEDVRALAKFLGLPNYNKPSNSCLASRIPFGERITEEKLLKIAKAELIVYSLTGAKKVRVRYHEGDIARIEVARDERRFFFNEKVMDEVYQRLKDLGFKYVTLDLWGYKSWENLSIRNKDKL